MVLGPEYASKMNLEPFIDGLMDQYLNQKELYAFRKKVERAAEKGIVLSIPDQSVSVFNLNMPLKTLLLYSKGKDILTADISRHIRPKLTMVR